MKELFTNTPFYQNPRYSKFTLTEADASSNQDLIYQASTVDARNPDFDACEHQICWPAWASEQSKARDNWEFFAFYHI